MFFIFAATVTFCTAQQMQATLTSDSVVSGNTPLISFYATCDIQNLSANDSLYVDLIRLENDMTPYWESAMCVDVCYPLTVDSGQQAISPLVTKEFKMYFRFLVHNTDTVHTKILFRNANDYSNYFIQNFYAFDSGAITSINANHSTPGLNMIYPNPAKNVININAPAIVNSPCPVSIYNSSGAIVYSGLISKEKIEINISALPEGIFAVRLGEKTLKFIKQ